MLSVLRRAVAVAALVALSAGAVEAQITIREIRVDIASFTTFDGNTVLDLGGPTSRAGALVPGPAKVAVGVYLNDKIAIEPSLSITNIAPDVGDATTFIGFGVFAPYYFQGDGGRNGLFVAPGIDIWKQTDVDALIDFGADVGYKKAINDNISWRAAGGFRTGDSTNDELAIVGTFGLSVFWK